MWIVAVFGIRLDDKFRFDPVEDIKWMRMLLWLLLSYKNRLKIRETNWKWMEQQWSQKKTSFNLMPIHLRFVFVYWNNHNTFQLQLWLSQLEYTNRFGCFFFRSISTGMGNYHFSPPELTISIAFSYDIALRCWHY